jgi:hypothetical protein
MFDLIYRYESGSMSTKLSYGLDYSATYDDYVSLTDLYDTIKDRAAWCKQSLYNNGFVLADCVCSEHAYRTDRGHRYYPTR